MLFRSFETECRRLAQASRHCSAWNLRFGKGDGWWTVHAVSKTLGVVENVRPRSLTRAEVEHLLAGLGKAIASMAGEDEAATYAAIRTELRKVP